MHVSPQPERVAELRERWQMDGGPIILGHHFEPLDSKIVELINEHGIYDAEYLMYKTNAPYLIRPDGGRYVRDKNTNKPLVWDVIDNCPKAHDDPSVTRVEYEDQAHEVALRFAGILSEETNSGLPSLASDASLVARPCTART